MTIDQGLKVLDIARKMIDGSIVDKASAAKELVALALDLAEDELDLHQYLTDAGRRRADAIVDAVESMEVGPK